MRIPLLQLIELPPASQARIEAAGFALHPTSDPVELAQREKALSTAIRGVVTNGSRGLLASEMAAFPRIEIACALGAGYERIDMAEAQARGITVTNGTGTNSSSVADHAMALLLSLVRGIPQFDAAARQGDWSRLRQTRPSISGKRLGILGLGTIGRLIAERGAGGFGMPVGYHNRQPRSDVPYQYHPTPEALATWADFLVIVTPGGGTTRHLVGRAVLEALGPRGFLVNVARGSVVDTAALIDALKQGRIAGAALDVVEGEPQLPDGLATLPNLILTPHVAGRSPEAIEASLQLLIANLQAHFQGRPVLTPVPG